ncbi:MAG TPA: DUF5681 domain-containing protein [Stellaceae bacterium]|nr:DUF5681 domain-containing protein [Stellaceae bacterium]
MIDYGDEWWPAAETGGAAPPVISDENRRVSGGSPPDNSGAFVPGARDEAGRFRPGVSANPARQFQPGQSGNPAGRPKGSCRAGARIALAMADAAAPEMMQTAIEGGRGGDGISARFVLARTVGLRRGQPVEVDLPVVAEAADLGRAVAALTAAVAAGSLTPEEALHLAQMLRHVPAVLAAVPPPLAPEEDHRAVLIAELDRLAAARQRRPKEVRRAELLAQLAAIDAEDAAGAAEPAAPGGLEPAVAEDQEQHQHDQQQPADSDPAAIAVTRIAVAAAAEQQDQQHDEDDEAHGSSPFCFRAAEGRVFGTNP